MVGECGFKFFDRFFEYILEELLELNKGQQMGELLKFFVHFYKKWYFRDSVDIRCLSSLVRMMHINLLPWCSAFII